MGRRKISAGSRRGGSSQNPAELPGPDVGLLELRYAELPTTQPWETVTLIYLPEFTRLSQSAADTASPADAIANSLVQRSLYVLLGSLSLMPSEQQFDPRQKRCGPVYVVRGSWAQPGWGPLLYDAGLDLSARHDRGMIADRASVSAKAQGIWRHFRDRRPDVESSPAPQGCPTHGQDELDRVYWATKGFPRAKIAKLRKQMQASLQAASRATGLPEKQVAHLLLDSAAMASGVALFQPPPRVVRRGPNPAVEWLEGRQARARRNNRKVQALKRRLLA